jgi:two-component system, response regulator PdtaR
MNHAPRLRRPGDKLKSKHVTMHVFTGPSPLSNVRRAASKPRDRFEALTREGGAGAGEPSKPARILVVEDDAQIGAALAEMLDLMGHEVCAIEATQVDAVKAAARCKPDLMIVDVRLGDGDGVSAVAEILRNGFIAHVFVSGDASKVRALESRAVAIQKPFRESDLVRAIERARGAPRAP